MEKSEQINELASALSKAQGAIKGALKDTANPFFKSKYADLSSVWEACREQLAANGLSVAQMPCESETGVMVETVLMHASGQWISNRFTMPVAKQDAQAVGSAITYSRRYALAAMVGVAPEDDDGNAATGNGDKIDRKTGEIKPSRITPTTGAVDALNQEDQKKAHLLASDILGFWKEDRKDEAHDAFYENDLGTDFKVAVWEILKPHSAIRNGLKKINESRRETA